MQPTSIFIGPRLIPLCGTQPRSVKLKHYQCQLEFAPAWLYLKGVGKTFHFECPQCHYRAQITGGTASGLHCEVQTIICRDCRELFDVFTRMRQPADRNFIPKFPAFYRPEIPPVILRDSSFQSAGKAPRPLVWQKFGLACPAQPKHFVEPWNDPNRCPRCGNYLEKNGFAFRHWD